MKLNFNTQPTPQRFEGVDRSSGPLAMARVNDIFPSITGKDGYILSVDGTNLAWIEAPSGGNIYNLNGTLTDDRTILLDGHQLIFNSDTVDGKGDTYYLQYTHAANAFSFNTASTQSDVEYTTSVNIQPRQIIMAAAYDAIFTSMDLTGDNITFTGDASFKGARYYEDYSANYTDRSLVDKAYVDTIGFSTRTVKNLDADTPYTLELADRTKILKISGNDTNEETIILPDRISVPFAVGDQVHFYRNATDEVKFNAGAGVTLVYPDDKSVNIRTRFGYVIATVIAIDTWLLSGDLADAA